MNIIQWEDEIKIEPGNCYAGLPNALYHLGHGISKSGLDLINRSPAHYKIMRDNPKPSTSVMEVGTAFHAAVLEPNLFAEQFVPDPHPGSYSKAVKEAREQLRATGKQIVANNIDEESGIWGIGQYNHIIKMAEAVRQHQTASILLDPEAGIAELSTYWVDAETHKLCKARADFFNTAHNILVDLKSTSHAGMTDFAKSCAQYRYHVQAAFYLDGFRAIHDSAIKAFVFVVAEKEPPYAVACYTLSRDDIELGRSVYRHDLAVYKKCSEADEWPIYGYDETTPFGIRELSLPSWASRPGIN